jgi:uncharacterized membrane protein YkvA (DUF1232 family)
VRRGSREVGSCWIERLKERAERLKTDSYALYLACRDQRTPWYAKVWLALVLGYLASPIDLIPDFIPVIGYLDDLLLVPAGLALAVRVIPRDVIDDCRVRARAALHGGLKKNWVVAILIISVWMLVLCLVARWLWRILRKAF